LLSFFTGAGNTAFREDVDNYLKQNLKNYDHYEFEILQAPENSNKIIINNDRPFSQNGGYANINVTVIDKKNSVSQSYITLKLKLYKNVLVSSQDIKSKEEISPEKVELKKLEVTFVKGEMFEKPEELAGNVAKMRINKGRIITSDIIEIAPVIKSGDLVNASAVRGNVIVTTDAIAKQDGRPGELIRILTRDNKQFKGKVIDSNNVIIIE
jgi:flagella basal body P-ring formation protein FlgA